MLAAPLASYSLPNQVPGSPRHSRVISGPAGSLADVARTKCWFLTTAVMEKLWTGKLGSRNIKNNSNVRFYPYRRILSPPTLPTPGKSALRNGRHTNLVNVGWPEIRKTRSVFLYEQDVHLREPSFLLLLSTMKSSEPFS